MSWFTRMFAPLRNSEPVRHEPGPPVTLTVQGADGVVHSGTVQSNTLVLRASRKVGLPLENLCANRGLCLTCSVRVPPESIDALSAADHVERRYLDWVGAPADVRLSCQARILEDATIRAELIPTSRWDYDTHEHWWNDLQHDPPRPDAPPAESADTSAAAS